MSAIQQQRIRSAAMYHAASLGKEALLTQSRVLSKRVTHCRTQA